MGGTALRVGALAQRTGLSVRTLHYYDEIGLLRPSEHSAAGYRLYTAGDVARLQQIKSLRQLGFTLTDIAQCLTQPAYTPRRVVQLHRARVGAQIMLLQQLEQRLDAIAHGLAAHTEVSVETFLQTIEVINMTETEFTPDQLAEIKARGEALGQDHVHAVEAEWPRLIAQVRDALDAGTDPADPAVQALAQRWSELVREFTGGNPEIARVLKNRYQQDPTVGRPDGDPRMLEYMAYLQKAGTAGLAAE